MLSNIDVKKMNRNKIFRYINDKDSVSRPEISKSLEISGPTVLQNINELMEEGYIIEVGEMKSTGGRKAVALASNKEKYGGIGIDITKGHIGVAVVDLSGKVIFHNRISCLFENTKEYYYRIADIVGTTKEHTLKNRSITGVGISIPGIINEEKRIIAYSHTLNIYNQSYEALRFGIPHNSVFVNDANSACYAEINRNLKNEKLIYISLSNSVGGAFYNNGEMYMGDDNYAGEFGHLTLYPKGKQCYCGKEGCLDAYCSAQELANFANGTLEDFFFKLKKHDVKCVERWNKYLDDLAIAINSLRMIFDCKVIVGGYVGSYIGAYLEDLRSRAKELNTFENDAQYIQKCTRKIEASAVGAAFLANELFIQNI